MKLKKTKNNVEYGEKNYMMKDVFDAEQLVIGKLEYISSEVTDFGPKCINSNQIYNI